MRPPRRASRRRAATTARRAFLEHGRGAPGWSRGPSRHADDGSRWLGFTARARAAPTSVGRPPSTRRCASAGSMACAAGLDATLGRESARVREDSPARHRRREGGECPDPGRPDQPAGLAAIAAGGGEDGRLLVRTSPGDYRRGSGGGTAHAVPAASAASARPPSYRKDVTPLRSSARAARDPRAAPSGAHGGARRPGRRSTRCACGGIVGTSIAAALDDALGRLRALDLGDAFDPRARPRRSSPAGSTASPCQTGAGGPAPPWPRRRTYGGHRASTARRPSVRDAGPRPRRPRDAPGRARLVGRMFRAVDRGRRFVNVLSTVEVAARPPAAPSPARPAGPTATARS